MEIVHFNREEIQEMEKRFRTNFINSLTGFKSANLIGSISPDGKLNLAIFSSAVHVGANPPLIGLIFRPVTVARHTYENIQAGGYYTINHIHQSFFKKAHQTAARYDRDVSEFDAVQLTPDFSPAHPAPYVKESLIKLGVKYEEEYHIKANDTIFVVGSIVETFLPRECLKDDGYVDLELAETVAVSGLDCYHITRRLARLSYAKPDLPLTVI
ncbi:MAG: flavin reductase family protein [candidate division KSB1 bacterium]|nr:flavin reductase family protein [candidate division KSB1 bacterium]MDZ7334058.1 flavin reductase family protein [candidate division KSB1 bacterium]